MRFFGCCLQESDNCGCHDSHRIISKHSCGWFVVHFEDPSSALPPRHVQGPPRAHPGRLGQGGPGPTGRQPVKGSAPGAPPTCRPTAFGAPFKESHDRQRAPILWVPFRCSLEQLSRSSSPTLAFAHKRGTMFVRTPGPTVSHEPFSTVRNTWQWPIPLRPTRRPAPGSGRHIGPPRPPPPVAHRPPHRNGPPPGAALTAQAWIRRLPPPSEGKSHKPTSLCVVKFPPNTVGSYQLLFSLTFRSSVMTRWVGCLPGIIDYSSAGFFPPTLLPGAICCHRAGIVHRDIKPGVRSSPHSISLLFASIS